MTRHLGCRTHTHGPSFGLPDRLPVYSRRNSEHDCQRLVAVCSILWRSSGAHAPARHLHGERARRQENLPDRCFASRRTPDLSRLWRRFCSRDEMAANTPLPCCSSAQYRSLLTYVVERAQHFLPWNPQGLTAVAPDLAWSTAASFTTNTNWQSYTPETTMSYLTQMLGPCLSQLRQRSVRHRRRHGDHPRHRPQAVQHYRQFLGRHDAMLSLHPAAHLPDLCAGTHLARRDPEHETLHRGRSARTAQPGTDNRPGPGRLAGSNQDARHERRRILQCQQLSSLRKPNTVFKLSGDAFHLPHPRGIDRNAGPNDGLSRSWLGCLCQHGGALHRGIRHCVLG